MPKDSPPLSSAVLAHVLQRLQEITRAWEIDDRPWYLRWFIRRGLLDLPPDCVHVRQLSAWDIETKTCSGDLLGSWLVTATSVNPVDESAAPPDGLLEIQQLTVFNFAFTANGDCCVVNEIALDGQVLRSVFTVRRGLHVEVLEPASSLTNSPAPTPPDK